MDEYEVGGYLIVDLKGLYEESRTCVKWGIVVGEYFHLRRGLCSVSIVH